MVQRDHSQRLNGLAKLVTAIVNAVGRPPRPLRALDI
jgi:hypothetical protein